MVNIKTIKNPIHKDLAGGRWFTFSFVEQMGHIGSEVYRASKWQNRDHKIFQGAVNRALELFDLTIMDKRWGGKLKEVIQARNIFCDAVLEGNECENNFEKLQKYFDYFGNESLKSIMENKTKIIVHACTNEDWLKAKENGIYKTESLESQGFIHFSGPNTIQFVANSHWMGRKDIILLIVDSEKVNPEIKYEIDPGSGRFYPHIYGPLNLDAVIKVIDYLPNEDGFFEELSFYF